MRHFDPVTKTEAIEGIHNLENTVELPDDNWFFTCEEIPEGKMLEVNDAGEPILVDVPQPTHEELVESADEQKAALLLEAKATISLWQTELQLGVISDEDKASLIAWVNYIKELQAVDTSTAPDITWPEPPAA